MRRALVILSMVCLFILGAPVVAPETTQKAYAHTGSTYCGHSFNLKWYGANTYWLIWYTDGWKNPKTGNHVHNYPHTKFLVLPLLYATPIKHHVAKKVCPKHK